MWPYQARRPSIYAAEAWEPATALGASDTRVVHLDGFAKLNTTQDPCCVANEYICGRLGQLMGLPIPPGAILKGPPGSGVLAWVTLTFAPGGIRLPPIDPAAVAAALPELAAEVIVFDVLIANTDRHAGNLAYMPAEARLEVFDHSHALLGAGPACGVAQYRAHRGAFATGGHCLIPHIGDPDAIDRAAQLAMTAIRDGAVARICQEAALLGLLSTMDATVLKELIIERRGALMTLVRDNRALFTSIDPMAWSP